METSNEEKLENSSICCVFFHPITIYFLATAFYDNALDISH